MDDKLSWLLENHYNLFHADLIKCAMYDNKISLLDFIDGCKAISKSEAETENDDFVPKEFTIQEC